MIVVTGGAGFIGSNLVHALNARNEDRILVVDDLQDGQKFHNIADAQILDYENKNRFIDLLEAGKLAKPDAIFHQGACSDTTEWDGRYMMDNNYRYSRRLLEYCLKEKVPFLYASSASVYGSGTTFAEAEEYETPINMYGYSKTLFDHYVRKRLPHAKSLVVGFRYFNVYGPREEHKGRMASVAYHFYQQIKEFGKCRLFSGSGGYEDGEQRRDFIYVDDVVSVNLWFFDRPKHNGIFNVGTGKSQSFNELAKAVIKHYKKGQIEYIPFPQDLAGRYQSFTEADLSRLRAVGYANEFLAVEDGVERYLQWLDRQR